MKCKDWTPNKRNEICVCVCVYLYTFESSGFYSHSLKATVITILDMLFIREPQSENIDAQNEWLWLKNINMIKVGRGT